MKVLLSWLREFAPFEGDPIELGNVMSQLGMAVEEMIPIGAAYDGIVVAKVLGLRKHPSADKIQLVDVDLGDGEALQICCGAFNMAEGDLVPLATLGTVMPGGLEIARRKLRGEWSNGMLCSASELEFSSDHEGILILPAGLMPGTPLRDALGIEHDVLYDLDLTGNRPEALSHAGVARDLAAKLKLPFAIPDPVVQESGVAAGERAFVDIIDTAGCGRFVARVLDNVRIEPSPSLIANRLTLCGMRPINNVVDVSNYVMLELGRPSHTFDLRKLANGSAAPGIRVRRARDGERIVTLDDTERALDATDLLICDQDDRPVGIAGVMGGANTEIDDSTTSVLLEMAWFEPSGIGATARRLGLRSEASLRFERGSDPDHIELCARRFAELLSGSGFTLAPGIVDARGQLPDRSPVHVRVDRVNALLGTAIERDEMAALITPIGFECRVDGADLAVVVPPFRPDTVTETDVAEEVARQYGYDRIAPTVPANARSGGLAEAQKARRRLRHYLADRGYSEAMPMPFLAPGDLSKAGLGDDGLLLSNPLAAEESVLRTWLRPGLLKAVAYNASHRQPDVRLFEIGHVYDRRAEPAPLPEEHERVALVAAGCDAGFAVDELRALADAFDVAVALDQRDLAGLHPTRGASVLLNGAPAGVVGEIDPAVLAVHGIDQRVAYFEIATGALVRDRSPRGYKPVSRFPSSDIDLSFEAHESISADRIAEVLRSAGGALLRRVELFDMFRSESIGPDKRSLTYRLRLQASDRTLTDEDVAGVRAACIKAVESKTNARLRG